MFNLTIDQANEYFNNCKNSVLAALTEAKYLSPSEYEDLKKRLVVILTKEKWFDSEHKKSNIHNVDVLFRNQFPTNISVEKTKEEDKND